MNPLDPQGHRTATGIALAYFYMRKFAEAEATETAVLHQHPAHPVALCILAASLAQQNRIEAANRAVGELLAISLTASVSLLSRPKTRHDWMSQLWADALRAVGLPE